MADGVDEGEIFHKIYNGTISDYNNVDTEGSWPSASVDSNRNIYIFCADNSG